MIPNTMQEVADTPAVIDPEAIRDYLSDLCLVGDIEQGGDDTWAIIGRNQLRPDDHVDLIASWSDFKHDLAILKEAGIKTVYNGNQPPDPKLDEWIISLQAETINQKAS